MTDCPVCLGTEVILVLQQVILLCQKIQMTFVSLSLGHQNGGWGAGGICIRCIYPVGSKCYPRILFVSLHFVFLQRPDPKTCTTLSCRNALENVQWKKLPDWRFLKCYCPKSLGILETSNSPQNTHSQCVTCICRWQSICVNTKKRQVAEGGYSMCCDLLLFLMFFL